MYYVSKRMEVAGAHYLDLDYESPCRKLHGHNWIITVKCKSPTLDRNGMVVDFAKIKKLINSQFDHCNLNSMFLFNPTAENIAKYICKNVTNICPVGAFCYEVSVQESEGNIAIYEEETWL